MTQHENMMVTQDVKLLRQLGQGGMGTIWVGYDSRLDREVAVKFITAEVLQKSPALKERFKREAQAAARIRSPYVVQIHAHGEQPDGSPYMVMELLEGQSVGEFLQSGGRLTYEHSAQLLGQVGKALAAAHKLGVVHRDIKPDNIFMLKEEDLFVKLLDFGIAKHAQLPESAGNLTATGSILGTPHYMSPEQLLDTKGVDHRADLWALGVVGYMLVTGELPFVGTTLAATIVAITSHSYAPPSTKGAPPSFDNWFATAFRQDIALRFSDAKSMTNAFAVACRQQAAALPRTPPTAALTHARQPHFQATTPQPATGDDAPPAHLNAPAAGASELGATMPTPPAGGYPAPPGPTPMPSNETPVPFPPGAGMPAAGPQHAATTVSDPKILGLSDAAATTVPADQHAAAPTMPQTFAGSAATLNREKKSGASIVLASFLAFTLVGGAAVGAYFYVAAGDDSGTGNDEADKPHADAAAVATARGSNKPTPSSDKPPTLPPAPSGMVAVGGGDYFIGCDANKHKSCLADEQPMHQVSLVAFAIMAHEVTMGDYDECVAEKKCPPAGTDQQCNWQTDGRERHPINCVTFKGAQSYCTTKGWRLPSEQEWEAAARSKNNADRYPWGNEAASCDLLVMKGGKPGCSTGTTMLVGSRPKDRSRVGAFDMAGNVREWTATDYSAYPGGENAKKRSGKVNRGGSYRMSAEKMSSVFTRSVDSPTEARPGLGFRCATDL